MIRAYVERHVARVRQSVFLKLHITPFPRKADGKSCILNPESSRPFDLGIEQSKCKKHETSRHARI